MPLRPGGFGSNCSAHRPFERVHQEYREIVLRRDGFRMVGPKAPLDAFEQLLLDSRSAVIIVVGQPQLAQAASGRDTNSSNIFISSATNQGKGNMLLFPNERTNKSRGRIACQARLGGLLRYYSRAA
ncbi:MAG: hypothetical protein JO323_07775 [Acidobacteriia bacterium]|nr:hypothetical protein [Terriglobia bacterium]